MHPAQLMDVAELCEALRLSRATVWRKVRAGLIPPPKKFGSQPSSPCRWRTKEIVAWVEAGMPVVAEWERMKGRHMRGVLVDRLAG